MKSNKITAVIDTSADLSSTNVVRNDPLQRNRMIEIAAYFRSEKRGFSPNENLADWFASEGEIDRYLNSFSS